MTKYKFTYHNAETNIKSRGSYDADNLADAFDTAWLFREDNEYVHITNTETNETFVTYDGVEFSVVPEV